MKSYINGYEWNVIYTHNENELKRSDGTIALGVTDIKEMSIYIYDKLNAYMERKVLTHELVHAFIFSYGFYLDIEQEEFICSFIDTYGKSIISEADRLLNAIIDNVYYKNYF